MATALAFTLVACTEAPAPEPPLRADASDAAPRTFQDDLGRTIEVNVLPARVLALAPSLTELVFAVGAGDRLPAVSTVDTFPPEVEERPRFSLMPLDHEAVVALGADLLLATTQVNSVESVAPLGDLGIPTYFFAFEALADIPRALRRLDALLGTTDGAAAADRFEARVAAFEAQTEALGDRPTVLLLVGDETLYAFGGASYTQAMVRLAGGRSVTADLDGQQAVLSDEFVLQADPDVIAVAAGADYDPASLVERHPAFATLTAVREGRVVGVDPDHVSRPGPRVLLGIEALAEALAEALGTPPSDTDASAHEGGLVP